MPQNTQKPAEPQHITLVHTSSLRSSTSCCLQAILGPAMGSLGQLQTPCHTRANCKINTLWLRQWQSLAKSPPSPDLVKSPSGTNVLKLHEGLKKAESTLAIQLRTGTNDSDAFFFQAQLPSVLIPLCSCSRLLQQKDHGHSDF